MKLLISTSAFATLSAKLKKANVPDDVIDSLEKAVPGSIASKDVSAITYARAMEKAFDQYGVDGLKSQVMYMLINLGKWQGEEARSCKKILKKWAYK